MGCPLDLGAADGLARVAAQAGEAAHRLGEETAVGPCDAHVPVVQLASRSGTVKRTPRPARKSRSGSPSQMNVCTIRTLRAPA